MPSSPRSKRSPHAGSDPQWRTFCGRRGTRRVSRDTPSRCLTTSPTSWSSNGQAADLPLQDERHLSCLCGGRQRWGGEMGERAPEAPRGHMAGDSRNSRAAARGLGGAQSVADCEARTSFRKEVGKGAESRPAPRLPGRKDDSSTHWHLVVDGGGSLQRQDPKFLHCFYNKGKADLEYTRQVVLGHRMAKLKSVLRECAHDETIQIPEGRAELVAPETYRGNTVEGLNQVLAELLGISSNREVPEVVSNQVVWLTAFKGIDQLSTSFETLSAAGIARCPTHLFALDTRSSSRLVERSSPIRQAKLRQRRSRKSSFRSLQAKNCNLVA